MAANMGIGLFWCAVAGIGFGTNFLPVKKIDVGDGVFFSFCMSMGIMAVGLLGSFCASTQESIAFETLPTFHPYAMLGGITWMLGNLMCPLIIKWIGLGRGLTVWDLTNMIVGWATGYFGLFNVPKEHVHSPRLNIIGISLAAGSLLLFTQAKDKDGSSDEETPCQKSEGSSDTVGKLEEGECSHSSRSQFFEAVESIARRCEMPRQLRWLSGFGMALLAGVLFGYTFAPAIELSSLPSGSKDQMDYVWSNFAGIIITGNVVFVIYVMVCGEKSFIRRAVVLPAILSGAIWAVAQLAWFKANEELSLSVAFPIVASLPGIVAMALGVCAFGELQSRRARIFALLGILVRLPGIGLIALSSV
eukprot:TRINITY_DN2358_c0_g1_i3.p1 TRINITY_DN2358_c0_g1~~TRINITY_DN2358_c0_g1_i3.p1  ORF type:complete len:361 (-),score=61.40 TRINITY_DN2358_c0_g1_i3:163-1245(-)